MVAERGCPQALPKTFFHQSIEGLNLGSEALVEGCFCCMAPSSAGYTDLEAALLWEVCVKRALDSVGPARVLRHRLVRHLIAETRASNHTTDVCKASVTTYWLSVRMGTPELVCDSRADVSGGSNSVLFVLLRRVPSLFVVEFEAMGGLFMGCVINRVFDNCTFP